MTLLKALEEMRKMVIQGKIVRNPDNLYEDAEGNEVEHARDASCGCLLGIAYIVADRANINERRIPGFDPFLWDKDDSCTGITKKGPKAMLKAIDFQIKKVK